MCILISSTKRSYIIQFTVRKSRIFSKQTYSQIKNSRYQSNYKKRGNNVKIIEMKKIRNIVRKRRFFYYCACLMADINALSANFLRYTITFICA